MNFTFFCNFVVEKAKIINSAAMNQKAREYQPEGI